MKQVWVNRLTCSATRAATRGAALPTETTAIPAPKSIRELPPASTMTPPPASVTNTGSIVLTPRATVRARLAISSREAGPGISVTRWRRCAGPAEWSVIQKTIDHLHGGRPKRAAPDGFGRILVGTIHDHEAEQRGAGSEWCLGRFSGVGMPR